VSAPTIKTVPTSTKVNVNPHTGKLPPVAESSFFLPRLPAKASTGTIMMKRPKSMANPRVVLYQGVFPVKPANALPLLPVPDE
jgi:hypothetical protein